VGEVKLDRDDLKKNNRKELNIWEQASVIVHLRIKTEEITSKNNGMMSVGNLAGSRQSILTNGSAAIIRLRE